MRIEKAHSNSVNNFSGIWKGESFSLQRYTPLAYIAVVVFVETPTFTRRVLSLLDDESYAELQLHLAKHPDAGAIIRRSGGMRKIRWAVAGRGKRGGARVIYYWWIGKSRISMLFIYAKNEQDDLSPDQLKQLKEALKMD